MEKRRLAGMNVTEIGLGTWQLGAKWGDPFNPKEARSILEAALENGINLIDTADVYNDSMSEQAIGEFLKDHKNDEIYVLTKLLMFLGLLLIHVFSSPLTIFNAITSISLLLVSSNSPFIITSLVLSFDR